MQLSLQGIHHFYGFIYKKGQSVFDHAIEREKDGKATLNLSLMSSVPQMWFIIEVVIMTAPVIIKT